MISIVGLSVGLACSILLGTYLLNELRFDRFHQYADRIALVAAGIRTPTDTEMRYGGSTPTAVAPTFSEQFPEVEKAARVYRRGNHDGAPWRIRSTHCGMNRESEKQGWNF